MNNSLISKSLIVLLIIFLSIVNVAVAGDSSSIFVSCSIPSVPGLNAPPSEGKTKQDMEIENENHEQIPSTLQEENQKKILLADGSTSIVITQTIYSR